MDSQQHEKSLFEIPIRRDRERKLQVLVLFRGKEHGAKNLPKSWLRAAFSKIVGCPQGMFRSRRAPGRRVFSPAFWGGTLGGLQGEVGHISLRVRNLPKSARPAPENRAANCSRTDPVNYSKNSDLPDNIQSWPDLAHGLLFFFVRGTVPKTYRSTV